MTGKTVTRMDLAEAVYHEVGLTRKAAQDLVDQVIEELCKVLERARPSSFPPSGTSVYAPSASVLAATPRPAWKFRLHRARC